MKKQKFFIIWVLLLLTLSTVTVRTVYAVEKEAGSAAELPAPERVLKDERIPKLRAFLRNHNSPLENESETFIKEADRNKLDWKLVVAIAGTESTFGKQIPKGSNNPFGWGIPTGAQSGIGFASWKEGIVEVSEGIRNNYMNRGARTIEQIGHIYASSPAWAGHVRFFIDKLNAFTPTDPDFLDVTI